MVVSVPRLLLLEPLCSAVLQAKSPMELPEGCSVPVGVQLVESVELVVEQLELEALDFSGLIVLSTVQSLVAALAAPVAAVAIAAADLLLT